MRTAEDIIEDMKKLMNYVEESQKTIEDGEMVDLQGLDKDVEALCKEALQLKPEQEQDVQLVMREMITKLEALAQSIETFKNSQMN